MQILIWTHDLKVVRDSLYRCAAAGKSIFSLTWNLWIGTFFR